MGPQDIFEMSDEDLMNLTTPPSIGGGSQGEEDPNLITTPVVDTTPTSTTEDPETPPEQPNEEDNQDPLSSIPNKEPETPSNSSASGDMVPPKVEGEQGGTPAATGSEGTPAGDKPTDSQNALEVQTPPDYEALYKKVMAPFTANGKTISLKDENEVIQLMQMGANYTRKMQEIAPARKILRMLENNKLLDESKLSFLIDLEAGNPEAIKKLLQKTGIEPHTIDTSTDSTYLEGNHRVSDEEVNFRSTLDDVASTPGGQETLQRIQQWDQASKEVLWKDPEIARVMHEHNKTGIYGRIADEISRRQVLGQIPANTPFLQAYNVIGQELGKSGALNDLVPQTTPQTTQQPAVETPPQPTPVAVKVVAPKTPVANGDKVNAASPNRVTPRKADTKINPLSMSDEEFEKSFNDWKNRL